MGGAAVDLVRAEASAAWPDIDWSTAVLKRGAFHDVLVEERVVARISRSRLAAAQMPARSEVLRRLRGSLRELVVPEVMSEVHQWTDTRVGCLLSVVPGDARSIGDAIPASSLATVLAAVSSVDPSVPAGQPLRGFCGGEEFPDVVLAVAVPALPEDLASAAGAVVQGLLRAEAESATVPIHGDLTPFNIMWHGDEPIGVLDWDFCALGDPALDIAGILTTLGRRVAEQLCDASTLERAARHRATFPLQIACAGYLHDDKRLFEAGINNFVSRCRSRTLYWPDGDEGI